MSTISRRRFVQGTLLTASAAAQPLGFPSRVRGANEQLRVAVAGLNRGSALIDWIMEVAATDSSVKLVAVTDTDVNTLNGKADGFEKKYNIKLDREQDFRRLLDRQDIDVMCVATPNHWHSLMSIMAIQAGKDVYCEKPVSHNVWEGRQLVNAARKYNKIVQTGTQSRASYGLHEAKKFLDEKQLGPIRYAIGTCYKPRKPIGKLAQSLKIPANLDYEIWCGPAEKREIFRPSLHYDWHWDFNTGNGDLGNQGIHQMDIARWMCGHNTLSPRVMALGTRAGYDDASNTPHSQLVLHDYPTAPIIFDVRGMPKAKEFQTDSGDTWQNKMDDLHDSRIGVVVYCEGGHVVIGSYTSGSAFDKEGKRVKSFNGGGPHMGNFIDAVRSRKRETLFAEIEEGHLSSALCHTGNISYQLGGKASGSEILKQVEGHPAMAECYARFASHLKANAIDIDNPTITLGPALEMETKTERFTNNDKANTWLTREYRKPWIVPDLSA